MEAVDSSQPGRRLLVDVQALAAQAQGPAWEQLQRQLEADGLPRDSRGRWFWLDGPRANARRLVMVVPGGSGLLSYSFHYQQEPGDPEDLTVQTGRMLSGVSLGGAPLPRL